MLNNLLRILNDKSKLGFGRYSELTIGRLLSMKKYPYLRDVYYRHNGITFTPKILWELKIYDKTIVKPGSDLEMATKVRALFESYWPKEFKQKVQTERKERSRARLKEVEDQNKRYTSKGYLQAKNHGR